MKSPAEYGSLVVHSRDLFLIVLLGGSRRWEGNKIEPSFIGWTEPYGRFSAVPADVYP